MSVTIEEFSANLARIFASILQNSNRINYHLGNMGMSVIFREIKLNDDLTIVDLDIQAVLQHTFADLNPEIDLLKKWLEVFEVFTRIKRFWKELDIQLKYQALNREFLFFLASKNIEWTNTELDKISTCLSLPLEQALTKFLGVTFSGVSLYSLNIKYFEPVIIGAIHADETELAVNILKQIKIEHLSEFELRKLIKVTLIVLIAPVSKIYQLQIEGMSNNDSEFVISLQQESDAFNILQRIYLLPGFLSALNIAEPNIYDIEVILASCLEIKAFQPDSAEIINVITQVILSQYFNDAESLYFKMLRKITTPQLNTIDQDFIQAVAVGLRSVCLMLQNDIDQKTKWFANADILYNIFKEFFNAKSLNYLSEQQMLQRNKIRWQFITVMSDENLNISSFVFLSDLVEPTPKEWREIIGYINIYNQNLSSDIKYKLLELCCSYPSAWINFTADEIDMILKTNVEHPSRRIMCTALGLPHDLVDLRTIYLRQHDIITTYSTLNDKAKFIYIIKFLYARAFKAERPEINETNNEAASIGLNFILSRMAQLRKYFISRIMPYIDVEASLTSNVFLNVDSSTSTNLYNESIFDFDVEISRRLELSLPKISSCIAALRAEILTNIENNYKEHRFASSMLNFIAENKVALISGEEVPGEDDYFCLNTSPFPAWRFVNILDEIMVESNYQGISTFQVLKQIKLSPYSNDLKRVLIDLVRFIFYAFEDVMKLETIPGLESLQARENRIADWKIAIIEMLGVAQRSNNMDIEENDQPSCVHGKVGWLFTAFKGHPILGFDQHEIVKEKTQCILERIFLNKLQTEAKSNNSVSDKIINMRNIYDAFSIMNDKNIFGFVSGKYNQQQTISKFMTDNKLYDVLSEIISSRYIDSSYLEAEILQLLREECNDQTLQLTESDKYYIELSYLSIAPTPTASERIFEIYTNVVVEFEESSEKLIYNLNLALNNINKKTIVDVKIRSQFKQALLKYIHYCIAHSEINTTEREDCATAIVDLIMQDVEDSQLRLQMTSSSIQAAITSQILDCSEKNRPKIRLIV